mmetsp:Transcript_38022/g.88460  ORF Transcript_38022/g.88460 Transcript_38022/m.88460 type:complete len:251 (+) Transcript_38022:248-1000(+)
MEPNAYLGAGRVRGYVRYGRSSDISHHFFTNISVFGGERDLSFELYLPPPIIVRFQVANVRIQTDGDGISRLGFYLVGIEYLRAVRMGVKVSHGSARGQFCRNCPILRHPTGRRYGRSNIRCHVAFFSARLRVKHRYQMHHRYSSSDHSFFVENERGVERYPFVSRRPRNSGGDVDPRPPDVRTAGRYSVGHAFFDRRRELRALGFGWRKNGEKNHEIQQDSISKATRWRHGSKNNCSCALDPGSWILDR